MSAKAELDIVVKHHGFQRDMGGVSNILKSVRSLMIGVAAAAGTMLSIKLASNWVRAFGEQEAAVKRLDAALKNSGANVSEWSARLQQSASDIQAVTTHGDEATLALMQYGLTLGNSVDQIEDMSRAAIGLSEALGVDSRAAMQQLTQAANGNYQMLARMIPELKGVTDATEAQDIINRKAAEGWQLARAEAQTTRGQFQQLWNTLGDLGETLGSIVVPSVLKAANAIKGLAQWAIEAMAPLGELSGKVLAWLVEQFKRVTDSAISLVAITLAAFTNWRDSLKSIVLGVGLIFVTAFEDLKHLLTVVVPEYLSWFSRNWKEVFRDAFAYIGVVVSNAWANLVEFFKGIWRWLKGEETDWKWTGLTEGFESTIREDLPQIADRTLSETELWMQRELGNSMGNIWADARSRYDAIRAWLAGTKKDVEDEQDDIEARLAMAPSITISEQEEAARTPTAKTGAAFEALAAAFNRIASAAAKPPELEAAQKTAQNTDRLVKAGERAEQQNERLASLMGDVRDGVESLVDKMDDGMTAVFSR